MSWSDRFAEVTPLVLFAALVAAVLWIGSQANSPGSRSRAALGPASPRVRYQRSGQTLVPAAGMVDVNWKTCAPSGTCEAIRIPERLKADVGTPRTADRFFDGATDRDGYCPDAVDPFRPGLSWTHRRIVYNAITSDLRGAVRSGEMRSAMGEAPPGSDRYRVTVKITLTPDEPVPIPSPAPDAVVTEYRIFPRRPVGFLKDDADTLYVASPRFGQCNLTYRVACGKGYRSTPLPDEPFHPAAIDVPSELAGPAARVIDAIGGLPRETFADTVGRLHAYFSTFVVAPIEAEDRRETPYETLALARKGVCRHRARTFFLTANAAGVETRLVENRLHSFCEVRLPDGTWRRLEFRLEGIEGPPGSRGPRPERAGRDPSLLQGLSLSLVPFLVILLAMVVWRGRREDVQGHHIAPEPVGSRFRERRWRDADPAVTRQKARELLELLVARMDEEGAPDAAGERGERIREMTDGTDRMDETDVYDFQRLYWDCYYILDGLQRREQQ